MTPAHLPIVGVWVLALLASPAMAAAPPTPTPPGTPTPVLVPPPPPPAPAAARLQGSFLLAGRVSTAENVRGEHRGENVLRTWTFSSPCPAGPCSTIALARRRARETDKLTLRLVSPGYYRGTGRFEAPLRCAKRTYRKGQSVPFTITVRITAAGVMNGVVLATRVLASYANRTRSNLTPCFAVLGHDAASYHGHRVGTPTTGNVPVRYSQAATRSVPST